VDLGLKKVLAKDSRHQLDGTELGRAEAVAL
jgi:hypothetical protein